MDKSIKIHPQYGKNNLKYVTSDHGSAALFSLVKGSIENATLL